VNKSLVGETFVVVIDEIGEITFHRDVMFKTIQYYDNKETAERVLAAVLELLEVATAVLPTCAADALIMKAMEMILAQFKPLRDRLAEQAEFTQSVQQG